jgi:hypothetical protein
MVNVMSVDTSERLSVRQKPEGPSPSINKSLNYYFTKLNSILTQYRKVLRV